MTTATGPHRTRAAFHRLRVAGLRRLTDDAVAVTFDVPDELRSVYRYAAGQHITIRWQAPGGEIRRNYSICAPAAGLDGSCLRIAVKRQDGGAFSTYANERLAVGDTLEVMTPTGSFGIPPAQTPDGRHHVAIAAGSGITPTLSVLSTLLATEPDSRVDLVYGNRSARETMFVDELADLKDAHPTRLTLLHVFSREPRDIPLLSGRIDEQKLGTLFATLIEVKSVDQWYLCGPFELVRTVRAILAGRGVDDDRVHFEFFHVDGEAPPVRRRTATETAGHGATEVTFTLDGRTSRTRCDPTGEHVLDAVLRARPDAPFSCRGGVCGTCRARLSAGEVEMDTCYALDEHERSAGYVLTCQSRPTTPTVTVDYDA